MGNGMENRGRGVKRSNRYPLVMLMVFVGVAAVTTLINMHNPLGFDQDDAEGKNSPFGSWKSALQRDERERTVTNPYSPIIPNAESASGWSRSWVTRLPGAAKEETFYCERANIRSDICHMHGAVRLVGPSSLVLSAVKQKTIIAEEVIKPYTRKWEKPCMDMVGQITVKSQYSADSNASRLCEVSHKVPAVVFSTGGYTGNVYHEFNDGLIPLFITAQHLKGEVVFVIAEYRDWWMVRYEQVIKQLSKYEVIDIANHTQSHCFSDVTVGLYIHDEVGIDQSLMPNHESIRDFRALLGKAFPLEEENPWEEDFPSFGSTRRSESGAAPPQLVIINREGSRAIINLAQVIELATRVGFNVTILEPNPTTEMKKIFWLLDRCDVLIGVHGAALTHFLFMRPGTVFIQIVPLGTDWAAKTYYGDPAKRLGLRYIEYKITVAESTLSHEYPKNDPILVNPLAVGKQGWSVIKEIYLGKQKVELSLPRFYKILMEAREKWDSVAAPSMGNSLRGRNPQNRHTSPSTNERQKRLSPPEDKTADLKLSNQRRG